MPWRKGRGASASWRRLADAASHALGRRASGYRAELDDRRGLHRIVRSTAVDAGGPASSALEVAGPAGCGRAVLEARLRDHGRGGRRNPEGEKQVVLQPGHPSDRASLRRPARPAQRRPRCGGHRRGGGTAMLTAPL
ncbi:hypothetical protein QJS66_21210 [Kocuria rhizophila]|nr:hypothetical protein QJS66_21210 [Kocuria rhizophila]